MEGSNFFQYWYCPLMLHFIGIGHIEEVDGWIQFLRIQPIGFEESPRSQSKQLQKKKWTDA